ncbi:hypothetical protein B586_03575 [Mycobacterium haemophilum DSM 44634]|nr:hypothetical protein B586_03575 [Mycobacterium haemophilum DSM 44634]
MRSHCVKAKQWDIVDLSIRSPPHHRSDDLEDEHFREKLDLRAERMATVSTGAVLLEPDRDVDMWLYLLAARVIGDGSTTERFTFVKSLLHTGASGFSSLSQVPTRSTSLNPATNDGMKAWRTLTLSRNAISAV